MNPTILCVQCGNALEDNAQFCPKCGTKAGTAFNEANTSKNSVRAISPKSGKVTLLLCIFLGMIGAHRFYVGKIGTGLLMLFTAGLVGVWVVIDLIFIVKNKFEDKEGNPVQLVNKLTPVKETVLIAGTVMAWFALFIASIAGLLMYSTGVLVDVAHYQLLALKAGNMQQAYSFTAADFQKNTSFDSFQNYVNHYPALIHNKNSIFTERRILNDTGYLAGTLTAEDGTQTPIVYHLVKENGQWKILNIQVVNYLPGGDNKVPTR